MDLLLDIGNTRAKYTFFDKGQFLEIKHCACADLKQKLEEIFSSQKIRAVAVSNVGIELADDFLTFLNQHSEKVCVVTGTMNLPLSLNYSTPHSLGADRICAVVGASVLFPEQNCIIFDFGTAMTVDFLHAKKGYMGGNISLGLGTRLKAIHDYTSKLPLISSDAEYDDIGTSTDTAVAAGIILGNIYEIESYISKYPDYKIIFTGGDAFYFEKKIKNPTFVVSNLVFTGLAKILAFYEM